MAQRSTDRLERRCSGLLRGGDRLVHLAMIASAFTSPAVMAAPTAAPPLTVEPKQPIPVTVAFYPPSPQYRLPEKLFISSGIRSMICPDAKSSTTMLQNIDQRLLGARKGSCQSANRHIKIREVLDRRTIRSTEGRETQYLAFRGEIWEAKGHLDKVFGVVDEAAHSASEYTQLEDWQHENAFFDGRLRRGPGVVKDTLSCPKLSTPVDLIKGRQSMDRDPSDRDRLRRMEALLNTCQPASGVFQPLAVLKRWEKPNGWVWTALKAQDGNGKNVSLLHTAPKPNVTP